MKVKKTYSYKVDTTNEKYIYETSSIEDVLDTTFEGEKVVFIERQNLVLQALVSTFDKYTKVYAHKGSCSVENLSYLEELYTKLVRKANEFRDSKYMKYCRDNVGKKFISSRGKIYEVLIDGYKQSFCSHGAITSDELFNLEQMFLSKLYRRNKVRVYLGKCFENILLTVKAERACIVVNNRQYYFHKECNRYGFLEWKIWDWFEDEIVVINV